MMVQWRGRKRVAFEDQHGGNDPQLTSTAVKKELLDNEEAVTAESPASTESCEQKCLTISQLVGPRSSRRARKLPPIYHRNCKQIKHVDSQIKLEDVKIKYKDSQIKHEDLRTFKRRHSMFSRKDNSVDRWSMERYKLAEKNMLEVMKAEGAAIDKPISRPVLRAAARKFIGDTGLLDHLLKHIDGKLAPGGMERFRRCYNTEGIMEYWLESADLVEIKRAAGVADPNWVPPSWSKSCVATVEEPVCPEELALLKEEMAKLKRDMEELVAKNLEHDRANPIEEMHKELMKWRISTNQRLMEISSSLSGMQEMYRELVAWKFKAEHQLAEISNSVNTLRGASKHGANLSPMAESWEDWLESSNLDNIQGEDFTSWLESTDPINVGRDASVRDAFSAPQSWLKPSENVSQDLVCNREVELLKEEVAKMKRDLQELLPKRSDDDQAKLTPDSSVTVNSKSDSGDSFFQEMLVDLLKFKAKMEQQMPEISSSVSSLQASKHYFI